MGRNYFINSDYGSPYSGGRVSPGRAPAMRRYGGYDDYGGPGPSSPQMNAPVAPPAPQMSRDTTGVAYQNAGRGPSPQFAASRQGLQRFPSYGETGQALASPTAPAAPTAPGATSPAAPFTAPINYGSVQRKRMDSEHTNIGKRLEGMDQSDPAYPNMKAHYDALTKQLYPPMNAPAPTSQPSGPAPVLSGNAPTSAPTRPAPIDTSTPEYKARLANTYATAAKDLDSNPTLGTTPIKATPETSITYGAEAARRAVEMGPDQMRKNEGSIRRVESARNNAATGAATAQNIAQLEGNQAASDTIGQRGAQFARGDYDLSKPATAPPAGAQPAPTAAAPAQSGQQASGGFQEGQLLHSPSNPGKYWKVVNGVPQPM